MPASYIIFQVADIDLCLEVYRNTQSGGVLIPVIASCKALLKRLNGRIRRIWQSDFVSLDLEAAFNFILIIASLDYLEAVPGT